MKNVNFNIDKTTAFMKKYCFGKALPRKPLNSFLANKRHDECLVQKH